jgi:pantoate kinase
MEPPRANRVANVVTVCCLGCGDVYSKPLGGGTVRANPGCPECGYVGWVLAPELPREGAEPSHFAEDRPRRRSA